MLKLYCTPRTIAAAVAITLHEAGLEHEVCLVDFTSGEQAGAAYLAINPKGRVPALSTPQGIVTETGAVLEYIAALAPQKQLVPSDPYQAALMREVMYYIASTMHVNHAHRLRGTRWARQQSSIEDMQAKVPENMAAGCAYVEERIKGPFVLGETFSLADACLYVVGTWLAGDSVDITNYPKLAAQHEAVAARPSVKAVRDKGLI